MAEFLRPDVCAFLQRWREVLFAIALLGFGLWWLMTGVGINRWLGGIFAVIGIGWGLAAIQRARFAQSGEGPGVVQLRERRLAYFGPRDGGIMDVADLTRLEIDPGSDPDASWVLTGTDGQVLVIPVNAAGAETLFDIFATLPGIRTNSLLDALAKPPARRMTVWQRGKPLLH